MFVQPSGTCPGEKTFYVRGNHVDGPNTTLTFVVRGPGAEEVRRALADRGYLAQSLIHAISPAEEGYRERADGTVLVAASRAHSKLKVFGPFNDESDARRWISVHDSVRLKKGDEDHKCTVYTPIEPDFCFRVVMVEGTPTVLDFPPNFFSTPL